MLQPLKGENLAVSYKSSFTIQSNILPGVYLIDLKTYVHTKLERECL